MRATRTRVDVLPDTPDHTVIYRSTNVPVIRVSTVLRVRISSILTCVRVRPGSRDRTVRLILMTVRLLLVRTEVGGAVVIIIHFCYCC